MWQESVLQELTAGIGCVMNVQSIGRRQEGRSQMNLRKNELV
jgi:hypothetical protein